MSINSFPIQTKNLTESSDYANAGGGIESYNAAQLPSAPTGKLLARVLDGVRGLHRYVPESQSWERTARVNVKDFGARGNDDANDQTAIQTAIQALFDKGGGTLFFPDGVYKCSGLLHSIFGSNLYIPRVDPQTTNSKQMPIRLLGESHGAWVPYNTVAPQGGAIIRSTTSGLNGFSALLSAGASDGIEIADKNLVTVYLQNLLFRTFDNPTLHAIYLAAAANAAIIDCTVDTGVNQFNLSEPTHNTCGIVLPALNNYGLVDLARVAVGGYGTGIRFAEHAAFHNVAVLRCKIALDALASYHLSWGVVNIFHCPTYLKFSGKQPIDFVLDLERAESGQWYSQVGGQEILDPGNVGCGVVKYKITKADVGDDSDPLTRTGASNVQLIDLNNPSQYLIDLINSVVAGNRTNFARVGDVGVGASATAAGSPGAATDGASVCASYPANCWTSGLLTSGAQTLQLDFNANRTFDEIDIFGLADEVNYTTPPTLSTTATLRALKAFTIDYWNGAAWVNIPECTTTANDKVWKRFTFTALTGSKVRLVVTDSQDTSHYAYVTEFQVWG